MTNEQSVDERISAWLQESAPEEVPNRVLMATFERTRTERQRRTLPRWRSIPATRSMFKPSLAAAAVVAVLVSGALLVSQPGQPAVSDPSPAVGVTPSPSQRAPSPSPTAEVSPPAVPSLDLTWTKVAVDVPPTQVAWLGDRFVLVDEDSGAVRTSTDGASWQILQPGDPDPGYAQLLRGSFATWQDDLVGWWNPEDGPDYTNKPPVTAQDILRIVRPPAAPTETTPFKGRIQSIGIGPAGIVAQVHSHLDTETWIGSKLGADWGSRYEEVSFKDGVLKITMKPGRGRGLKVVWADEGFEPGDFQDAGFGWYSPDGEQWTLMPAPAPDPDKDGQRGFLTGFGDVVGVSDGFIARGIDTECSSSDDGCAGMWHSSDGLTWRNIGNVVNGTQGHLLSWMGGALVTDGVRRFDFWTSDGQSELPMAADVRAAWKEPRAGFGTGPLGLVTVLKDDKRILITRDGVDWDIQPTPAEMAADQTLEYDVPSVAVGERSVLAVMWSGRRDARIPSLWFGTLEP